jgi:hypothetical protein
MARERELVPLHTLEVEERQADERWPVPYAMMFITVASVTLWALIIAAANWLLG